MFLHKSRRPHSLYSIHLMRIDFYKLFHHDYYISLSIFVFVNVLYYVIILALLYKFVKRFYKTHYKFVTEFFSEFFYFSLNLFIFQSAP